MTALCLHYAIRPSFIHPSSLSPPSLLASLPVACFRVRTSLCMGLGGVNSPGVFRVCRFCESASPRVHWPRWDCASTHPHAPSAAGAEWGRTLVHTVILAGFLLVLVDTSLGWLVLRR